MTADKGIYPVALERDVKPHSLVRSRLDGIDLVIWRSGPGTIHVWEDRCPHRSVRLSAGRNLGDCVEGIYHGWRFDEQGRVSAVPAEGGKARPGIRVRVLHSEVRHGIIWASTGGKAKAPHDFHGELCRPVHIAAPAERVRAHLSDIRELNLVATPWNTDECLVFGVSRSHRFDARDANHRLTALGRRIEVGSS